MKRMIQVTIACFIVVTSMSAQVNHWAQLPSGTTQGLVDVDFVNVRTGWMVGYNGTLLKSTDSGTTWSSQNSDTLISFSAVDFIDSLVGWVVGYDTMGSIRKTTDGGSTWTSQLRPEYFNAIHFVTPQVGWALGTSGVVLKSTNGGVTWTRQTVPDTNVFFNSMFFIDSTTGWIGCQIPGEVLKTTNGGTTWLPMTSGIDPNESINAVYFVDQNIGWAAGYNLPGKVGVGVILKSTDGGVSWSDQSSGTSEYLLSAAFLDTTHGWIAGGGGVLLRTGDGGLTWSPDSIGTFNELDKIDLRAGEAGWIVGQSGTLLRQDFGGISTQVTVADTMDVGWNIVSIPVVVSDNRKASVFSGTISNAFGYNGGYQISDSLHYGYGYWLKFPGTTVVNITGSPIDSLTVSLSAGWNIIGSITKPILVSSIAQQPPGSVLSVFGYQSGVGYSIPSSIKPGKGYWMKTSQNCTITMSSSPNPSVQKSALIDVAHLDRSERPPVPPDGITEQQPVPVLPKEYALSQNYPNPFNPTTTISFDLPEPSRVLLRVFNTLGQEVATLVNGDVDAGSQSISWNTNNINGQSLSSGIYIYRIHAASLISGKEYRQVNKMMLIK